MWPRIIEGIEIINGNKIRDRSLTKWTFFKVYALKANFTTNCITELKAINISNLNLNKTCL